MPEFHVHWITVLGATAAYFALGAIWYGMLAGPWLRAIGMTRDEVKRDGGRWVYGVQLVSTFAVVLLASYVLHDALGVDDAVSGLLGGLLLGVIASLTSTGDFLYEQRRRSLSLFLINSGYRVAGMLVLGVLVGVLA